MDLIQTEQACRERAPELRVVTRLHHEPSGELPLQVERPRVILREAAGIVGLPVRDVAAIERFRHEERRLRPGGPASVPVESGTRGKGGGGDGVAADETVPMRASPRGFYPARSPRSPHAPAPRPGHRL